jgi:hypothetical protein
MHPKTERKLLSDGLGCVLVCAQWRARFVNEAKACSVATTVSRVVQAPMSSTCRRRSHSRACSRAFSIFSRAFFPTSSCVATSYKKVTSARHRHESRRQSIAPSPLPRHHASLPTYHIRNDEPHRRRRSGSSATASTSAFSFTSHVRVRLRNDVIEEDPEISAINEQFMVDALRPPSSACGCACQRGLFLS